MFGNLYTALRMSGLGQSPTSPKCKKAQRALTQLDRSLLAQQAALAKAQARLAACRQKHPSALLKCRALSKVVDQIQRRITTLQAKKSQQAQLVYSVCTAVPPPPPPPPPPTPVTCGAGTVFDAATNSCKPVTPPPPVICGTGTVFNSATNSCVPVTTPPPPPPPVTCGTGFVYDALRKGCMPIGGDAVAPPPESYPYLPVYSGGGGGGGYAPVFTDVPTSAPGYESFDTGEEGALVPQQGGAPVAPSAPVAPGAALSEASLEFAQNLPLEYSDEFGKMKVLRVVIASQSAAAPQEAVSGGGAFPGVSPVAAIESEEMMKLPGF